MRLQVLIGFPNQDGSGTPVIVGSPSSASADIQKQAVIFESAKRLHKFPKDVKFLAFGCFESNDVAIFINDKVAGEKEKSDKARLARVEHANATAQAKTNIVLTRNAIPKAKLEMRKAEAPIAALTKAAESKEPKSVAALKSAQETFAKAKDGITAAEVAHAEAVKKHTELTKK